MPQVQSLTLSAAMDEMDAALEAGKQALKVPETLLREIEARYSKTDFAPRVTERGHMVRMWVRAYIRIKRRAEAAPPAPLRHPAMDPVPPPAVFRRVDRFAGL